MSQFDGMVEELLVEWEERRHTGEELSAEELCHECPELLPEIQRRISALKATDWMFSVTTESGIKSRVTAGPPKQLGEYEILQRIGAGGMGTVYKARHRKLDKHVALKVLPTARLWDEQAVARFEREMRAVGKLEHSNIVAAYDAGEDGGTHFLAMQLIDGTDVGRIAKQHGSLAIADACEIIRQAAIGLHHAHEHGLVHRDVKPSNLMLGNDGQVRLLDLGLARLDGNIAAENQSDISSANHAMGTIDYMSPEQYENSREATSKSDMYSLGATLYLLLCGQSPLAHAENGSWLQKIKALSAGDVRPIVSLRNDLPPALTELIDRMLASSAADRPASAAEVADKLSEFALGSDLTTLASSPVSVVSANGDTKRNGATVGSAMRTDRQASGQNNKTWWSTQRTLLVVIALGLILAAAAVIYVETDNGTLVVKAGEGVTVEVLKESGIRLLHKRTKQTYDVRIGKHPHKAGEYIIQVTQQPSGLEFSTYELRIGRGDTEELLVTLKARPKPPTQSSIEREAAKQIIEIGGKVDVKTLDGVSFNNIAATSNLPAEEFQVTRVNFGSLKLPVDALSHLAGLRHVTFLELKQSNCSAEHLRMLPVLPSLKTLACFGCRSIADDCLSEFARQKSVTDLQLHHTKITGTGLASLSTMPKLARLWLSGTATDDDGLPAISKLQSLTRVYLRRCNVSDDGIAKLHSELPDCTIFLDDGEILPHRPPAKEILALDDQAVLALVGESDQWTWSKPEVLANINTKHDESQPWLSADGLTLWFNIYRRPTMHTLWMSRRESIEQPFPAPVMVPRPVNAKNDSSPSLRSDQLELFFVSMRPGGIGHMDIWRTTRASVDAAFGEPQNLGDKVNTPAMELSPAISGDGLSLVYSSIREQGAVGTELFECRRKSRDQSFGPAVHLGPNVNSDASDSGAWLSAKGKTLVFRSHRHSDLGRDQLYVTTRAGYDQPFHMPIRLAAPFTTYEANNGFAANANMSTVVFASNRPGGSGGTDLWITHRIAKPRASQLPRSAICDIDPPNSATLQVDCSVLKDKVNYLRFSPDGSRLFVSGVGDAVVVVDPKTGKELQRLNGHKKYSRGMAVSSDGATLFSGDHEGRILEHDLGSGELKREIASYGGSIRDLSLSPDGTRLAAAVQGFGIRVLNLSGGEPIAFHGNYFICPFGNDRETLFSFGLNKNLATFELNSQKVTTLRENSTAMEGTFCISTERNAGAFVRHDGTVDIFEAHSGKPLRQLKIAGGSQLRTRIAPKKTLLAVGMRGKMIQIINMSKGTIVSRVTVPDLTFCSAVEFSPDGGQLVVGTAEGRLLSFGLADNLEGTR